MLELVKTCCLQKHAKTFICSHMVLLFARLHLQKHVFDCSKQVSGPPTPPTPALAHLSLVACSVACLLLCHLLPAPLAAPSRCLLLALLAACCLLLLVATAPGCSLLFVACLSLFTCCSNLSLAACLLLVSHCMLLVASCLMLHNSLPATKLTVRGERVPVAGARESQQRSQQQKS
jgi:hypothetical protein